MDAPADSRFEFTPVPLRARRDGCTPERQAALIHHLRQGCCVLEACRRVGLSSESAYRLFRHSGGESFRRAWRAALAGPRLRSAPSTSAPGRPETNGSCRIRQDRQLPAARQRSPRQLPPYSLEAFARMVRTQLRRSAHPQSSTSSREPDGNEWDV
jgi:AraC-like DNA-binding protein